MKTKIYKFVNIYGVKFITYFTYDENNHLIDSGYYDFNGDFDHFEQIMCEDYQRLPNTKLIIERLDKYGTHS